MSRARSAIGLVTLCVVVAGATAGAQTVVPVTVTGESDRRVDLLVLGDGYTSAQLPTFASDAQNISERLFNEEPFREYRGYFNVRRIDVASAESGVSHPNRGITRNTAFGAYYNCGGIERLVCVDQGKVSAALRLVPYDQRDIVLVVVNDTEYGGSGGAYAVTSLNAASVEVALHEIGHGFGQLADEYGGPAPPACSDSYEPWAANATKATDRANIKWSVWIDPATPIPTTTPAHGVPGLYCGAAYCDNTLYRPTYDSKMRVLDRPFEQVNTEQLVKRFYSCAGPIDSASPEPDATVTLQPDESRTFSITVPIPATHDLEAVWRLDNVDQPRAGARDGLQFVVSAQTLSTGPHTLTVAVSDPTTMVRRDPENLLADSVTWNISITGTNRPDFEVVPDAVLQAGLTGAPGSRLTGTMTVRALQGYTGPVNLGCSVTPAGPSCSVTPSPLMAGSSATLAVDLTGATTGGYSIAVTAWDGQITRSSVVSLRVAAADFDLVPPGPMSGDPRTSQQAIVNVVSMQGYSATVTVGCSIAPAGPTCRVSPGAVATGESFTVTVELGVANAGAYAVTVNGTDGQKTHSATFQLVVAASDFGVQTLSATKLVVSRGQSGSVPLTAVPTAGVFNAPLTFACSGLPAEARCTFNPPSIDAGATIATSTVTITTTGAHAAANHVHPPWLGRLAHRARARQGQIRARTALCAAPLVLPALGTVVCARRRRRDRLWRFAWLALALVFLPLGAACSRPQQRQTPISGTPPGTYSVTLTAASGTHTHSTTLVLVVQ